VPKRSKARSGNSIGLKKSKSADGSIKKRRLISLTGSECREIGQKVQVDHWKRRNILFDQYRVVVGGVGIIYDGDSVSEAKRQFKLFMDRAKTARSDSATEAVTLFKNYEIIREYRPSEGG